MVFAQDIRIEDQDRTEPRFHADGKYFFPFSQAPGGDDHDNRSDEVQNQKAAVIDRKAYRQDDRKESGCK